MSNSQLHLVQEAAASSYSFVCDRVSFFHRGYGSSKSGGLLTTSHSSVDHHTDTRDSDMGIRVSWNLPCHQYSHQAPPSVHKSQDPIFALGCSPQQTFPLLSPCSNSSPFIIQYSNNSPFLIPSHVCREVNSQGPRALKKAKDFCLILDLQ